MQIQKKAYLFQQIVSDLDAIVREKVIRNNEKYPVEIWERSKKLWESKSNGCLS